VIPPDNILLLQLQPDSDSICNWYTLRVANTKYFRLILYYHFSCNRTVVRVANDVHSKLQILSASVWYCTTPSVATGQLFELQSMYTPSCKYWVLPPDTVLPLSLQPDNGSSCNRCTFLVANTECFRLMLYYSFSLQPDNCNWYTLRVANSKCSRLILYYPFSCNRIVVRVAIDVHSELQILIFQGFHLVRSLHRNCAHIHNSSWFRYIVATGLWYNLQFDLFDFFSLVHTFTCLVVLLQLAHGTCGNLVHFDFLLSKFNPRMCWKCAHTQ
jgi:hypothetical protein